MHLLGIELGVPGSPVLCLITVLTEPFRVRRMKSMQLTLTHDEEFCDLIMFARKVSGWSGFDMSRMGVAVVSPELYGGS